MPIPTLLEELGQQHRQTGGHVGSLVIGSACRKAMAQDAVELMQVTWTKSWVAGLPEAQQTASYGFQSQQLQDTDDVQLQGLPKDGRQRVRDDFDVSPCTAHSQGARKCIWNCDLGSHSGRLPPH